MPRGVCTTSGWNCTAYKPRSASSMAATGAPSLVASVAKPAGAAVTQSRWLIQHCSASSRPSSSMPSPGNAQLGLAELARAGARDGAAELERHELGAVADAQHGHAQVEERRVGPRRVVDVDAHGAAREDQALGPAGPDLVERRVEGDELRVDVALTHAARDELPVLGAEVEHEDGVVAGVPRRCAPRGRWRGVRGPSRRSRCHPLVAGAGRLRVVPGRGGVTPSRRPAPSAASCPRS